VVKLSRAMKTCPNLGLFGGRGASPSNPILEVGARNQPCGILLLKASQKALYDCISLRPDLLAAVRQHGHQTVQELREVFVRVVDSDFRALGVRYVASMPSASFAVPCLG
jgi:hypothetical protein